MDFQHQSSCHYKTLGLSKDCSRSEIKAAFRKLSFESHPDIVGAHNRTAGTKKAHTKDYCFKTISEAYRVLSNQTLRKRYDNSFGGFGYHFNNNNSNDGGFPNHQYHYNKMNNNNNRHGYGQGHARPGSMHSVLEVLFKPRNMFLGGTIGVFVIGVAQSYFHTDTYQQRVMMTQDNTVEAWYNPKTRRYEQPAPWDPIYQKTNPTLTKIHRDKVYERTAR